MNWVNLSFVDFCAYIWLESSQFQSIQLNQGNLNNESSQCDSVESIFMTPYFQMSAICFISVCVTRQNSALSFLIPSGFMDHLALFVRCLKMNSTGASIGWVLQVQRMINSKISSFESIRFKVSSKDLRRADFWE